MEHTYSEVRLQEDVVHPSRDKDIQDWVTEFSDIFTMEPGLTHLTEFEIDTSETASISQKPYNTPVAL